MVTYNNLDDNMWSTNSDFHAFGPQFRPSLSKKAIRGGSILWLRKDIDGYELTRRTSPPLEIKALNHPIVVIDVLDDHPSDVQICVVTSLGGKEITNSKVKEPEWTFYLPIAPTYAHPSSICQPLHLEDHRQMSKCSYVNTRGNYRVPMSFLREYKCDMKVGDYRLTCESFHRVRAACHLPIFLQAGSQPSQNYACLIGSWESRQNPLGGIHTSFGVPTTEREQQNAAAYTQRLPDPFVGRRQPPSRAYTFRAPVQALPVRGSPGGLHVPTWLLDTERQSLLPTPTIASRSHSHPPTDSRKRAWGRWIKTYISGRAIKARDYDWSQYRQALLVSLHLLLIVALLSMLGYGLYLGSTWLFHALVTLFTGIKAEFITIGRWFTDIGRSVANLVEGIVRWVWSYI